MDLRALFSETRPKVGVLPSLEATLTRRVLVIYRADPVVLRRLVPAPLELATRNGCAVVGISLMRLAELRVRGMSSAMGLSAENMAHHAAIRYPAGRALSDGLFIWRRDTDSPLLAQLGGRLVPAEFRQASFAFREGTSMAAEIRTERHEADVSFVATPDRYWRSTPIFRTREDACEFCCACECVFSCAWRDRRLFATRLPASPWEMTPLRILRLRSAFFESPKIFPKGSIAFDSAVLLHSTAEQREDPPCDAGLAGHVAAAA